MKMNKKADLPIIVLVIGVVGIFILTILSFVKVNIDTDEAFLGIGLIETMSSVGEELEFYKETDFEGDYKEVFERGDVQVIINGKNIEGKYVEDGKTLVWIEYKKYEK